VPAGWNLTSIVCNDTNSSGDLGLAKATFNLEAGETVKCTFTNTLIPPVPGSITIIKDVVPNDSSLWDFTLSGPTPGSKNDLGDGGFHTFTLLASGTYTVTEQTQAGYSASVSCNNGSSGTNSVSFNLGEEEAVTCTFTNTQQPVTLIVIKHVVTDNGGTAVASNFTMTISGVTVVGTASFPGAESPGTTRQVYPGTYNVTETGPAGYSASYSADCSGSIALGETKTCTITNNDIAPTLKLVKTVINDNGGTLTPANFPVRIDGASVAWGVAFALSAGPHTASETTQTGYAASAWSGDCAANGTITLALGQTKTCTITNNDIPPTPTLSADAHAFCSAWWVDFYSNVTAQYYIRVKLDGHTEFEESGAFIGNKSLHGDWHLGGTDIRIMRMTYWVKVGDQQVGDDETWTRDCGTPPPPPPPPPPPTPTPTPFIEILEVERLPVTGAVSPSGPFGAPWLSAIGLLLIASGGILHWLKKRE
jgi:LPXTG-motif cell wall-anchored protein